MRKIVGGIIAAGLTLTACTSLAGTTGGTLSPATSPATIPSAAVAASSTAPAVVPATSSAPAAPVVLLDITGNGIKNTADFTAGPEWTIAYHYDCSSFGSSGNFAVTVNGTDGSMVDLAANELGTGGSSSTVEHGAGTFYLGINSECNWHVQVTS